MVNKDYQSERNNIWHGRRRVTEDATDKAQACITSPTQHRLRRHKNRKRVTQCFNAWHISIHF